MNYEGTYWYHLASKSFLPVLIPLLPMTIKNKDRQSNVVFCVLLVQTKLLMRIPVNNKLCLKTSVFQTIVGLEPELPHALDHPVVQSRHLLSQIPGEGKWRRDVRQIKNKFNPPFKVLAL